MRKFFKSIIALCAIMIAASCSNDESVMDMSQDNQSPATRNVGVKTPKLTIYVETNDINPLNMGEYRFEGTDEQVVDHVILFASNIRGTVSSVELYHNPNQQYILDNVATLVRPLQQKGIKVLLGLLGDHTGVGFANLNATQQNSFAQQIADCVNKYGLDGVDFDDEYAEYGKISGVPSPSGAAFSALIQKVRTALPAGKLITAFRYGYATSFNSSALNTLDYMWPNFGAGYSVPSGFSNSKWASMSIQYTQGIPSENEIVSAAKSYGAGAIMMFNVREYDASAKMNCFAPYVWGKNVKWTGKSYIKNYGN